MKVSDFVEGKLMEIGATPEYTGYKYLVCAIVMSMQNEYLLNNVTTKMYPAIGKRYGVSPASIERSIRTVISALQNPEFYATISWYEPVCWNWQTRRTQNPLLATACGFESHHRHHN